MKREIVRDEDSIDLLRRWKNGDGDAAQVLFDRYVDRLVGLARTRLSSRMQRRVEPEDIVQSAYRSFFRKAGDGRYALEQSGDLWKLLATLTVSKVRGQVEFHSARKRAVYDEESRESLKASRRVHPEILAEEPTPDEAAAVVEELQAVMAGLDAQQRRILELALQNHSVEEISEQIQRSGRTVRRTLQQIRSDLETRLLQETTD